MQYCWDPSWAVTTQYRSSMLRFPLDFYTKVPEDKSYYFRLKNFTILNSDLDYPDAILFSSEKHQNQEQNIIKSYYLMFAENIDSIIISPHRTHGPAITEHEIED